MNERDDSTDVAGLSAERRQLLAYLLEEEGISLSQAGVISPRSTDSPLPLTSSQLRLWFLAQLEPDSPLYNLSGSLLIEGHLESTVLERALSEITRRHESLRTVFHADKGRPVQVITPPEKIVLPVRDLRDLPSAERQLEASRIACDEARQPFDLVHGPLIRMKLLRLAEERHVLLLSMHHIIMDGSSIMILAGELAELYEAYANNSRPSLPELPVQYADYAIWQQESLKSDMIERQLAYWKKKLGGRLPLLELPTDRPRSATSSFEGANESVVIPEKTVSVLSALGHREEVTLFMTLVAAFTVLLHRYTSQEDIIVGSPILNRDQEAIKDLIGFFVNSLLVRTDLSGGPTFLELLRRVREATLEAYDHKDVPFERLVEVLQPERDLNSTPLFQVNLTVHDDPMPVLEFAGLKVTAEGVPSGTSKFDLTLELTKDNGRLEGWVEYRTDLFDASTIRRMIVHLETLLESIAATPDQRISQVQLMTEDELGQILVDWNDNRRLFPQPYCIHQIFEEQVDLNSDAPAVVFEDQELSYAELNRRANQLARRLRSKRVEPEVLVGICVERSLEMVVGLLGILKAGGAYVPLDPEYPVERLAYILEDSGSRLLLTQRTLGLVDRLKWEGEAIYIDTDWHETADESPDNLNVPMTSENLVYVIYTSGSTGLPKGAMLTHRGIRNRLLWGIADYNLGCGDGVLNKTVLSFDVSVWEIFAPLCCGARLVVARSGGQHDAEYLVRLIQDKQVTHIDFVPSMLQFFLQEEEVTGCASIKRVTAAGEALSRELAEQFHGVLRADLYNLYGPTETSLAVTFWNCEPDFSNRVIPIGRPMSNVSIYVLDSNLQPVPVGVIGEIHVGGIALGRGYHRRPDQTATKYVPDLYGMESGGRLYKTGDLGKYTPEGNVEYIGRIDHQVKVRGFRIELGEIEAVLLRHPGVEEAVVMARNEHNADARLVAYVVADGRQKATASELKEHVREKLPTYMEPSLIVMLEKMPLTENGKVDRKALAGMEVTAVSEQEFEPPRDELETSLAEIWAEQLGLERVGINSNFFELGGHSLLAPRVLALVHERLGAKLTLRSFFEALTIAEFAQVVRKTKDTTNKLRAPTINRISRDAYRMDPTSLESRAVPHGPREKKEA